MTRTTRVNQSLGRPTVQFPDISGSTHARGIRAITAAEITAGRSDGTFGPQANTRRGQTATFMLRALAYQSANTTWVVTNIVDGDTLDARSSTGLVERIRVIGIDTPERGECGFAEAANMLSGLVLGKQVTLVAGARDNHDRYDRLLRYVDVGSKDAGLELIKAGLAIARYDSRDGYGAHPREASYVAADAAAANIICAA
jgi:micrococcal nuclease